LNIFNIKKKEKKYPYNFTFKPEINQKSQNINRSVEDLLTWG